MPIQAPQWTDYLNCPVCCREFGVPPRSPISLGCGHTLCKHCLKHLHRRQCPFDQTVIHLEPEELVVNTALLQLAGYSPPAQPYHPPCVQALPEPDRLAYDVIVRSMEHMAAYLKFCGNANQNSSAGNRLSRPMQRKLVTLLQCAMTDGEGRGRAARAARSLGERTVTELILQHQNPQQLSANLWAAVRARGCQFLGPAMQEEVLKLVLLALEDGSALSRKVLVMFVVQRLEPHFPQASKTSIGHVVQLLYRASCFKVSKRESDSSLMQLKEEFRTYESLRREHDAQIVQVATEAGLRIAPDQWSALLYGDATHKSHMQSIIDKLQTPQSFAQSIQELFIALQRTGDPAQLIVISIHLDRLANIDASPDSKCPTWQQLAEIMSAVKEVFAGLVNYLQQHSGRDNNNQRLTVQERTNEPSTSQISPPTFIKYKVSMCRDTVNRSFCPRGNSCTFAHSEEELERYRHGFPVLPPYVQATNESHRYHHPSGQGTSVGNGSCVQGGQCGTQHLAPNMAMPPLQIQHATPDPHTLYVGYPPQRHVFQRQLENYGRPSLLMPASGMPLDIQYGRDFIDYNPPCGYPQPVIQAQTAPIGLNQNTVMIPVPDRSYWRYTNIMPYNDEQGNYLPYRRAGYTRPLYGVSGPPPPHMPYTAPGMAPMNSYVPEQQDGRSSSSPNDTNGYREQPAYRYDTPANNAELTWQSNNEQPAYDNNPVETSEPSYPTPPQQQTYDNSMNAAAPCGPAPPARQRSFGFNALRSALPCCSGVAQHTYDNDPVESSIPCSAAPPEQAYDENVECERNVEAPVQEDYLSQMFRVAGDRRSVGPEQLAAFVDRMATAGVFDFSNIADDTLVAELQALERRIDTEYKSAE